MNPQDMLDYALGQLDPAARDRFDRELAADPPAAEALGRLTFNLNLLLDDGGDVEPPDGLGQRTLDLVARQVHRKRTILDFVPTAVPFRWGDVAVAAGVLVAGVLTLLPAVHRSREQMQQAGCGYNLQQLGRALWQYGNRHHHYPFAPDKDPKAPAGAFAVMLEDNGLLNDLRVLDCPCDGVCETRKPLPDFKTACQLGAADSAGCKTAIGCDYAYNTGNLQPETGRVTPIAAAHTSMIPMLADQPSLANPHSVAPGNSPNHGGRGQNVLYNDLHVGWHNTRRLNPNDSDMFLNNRNQLAPGLGLTDAALLPSHVPCLGWSTVQTPADAN